MRLFRRLVFVCALASTTSLAQAGPQEWHTLDLDLQYRINVHRTLGFVRGIAQTPDGYLWFGTSFGVARYDGVRFAFFESANTPEIKDDHVQSLISDGQGGLWIGTQTGGIVQFKDGRFHTVPIDGIPNDADLNSVDLDDQGTLWVGTRRFGLLKYRDGTWGRVPELGIAVNRSVRGYGNALLFAIDDHWWRVKDGQITKVQDVRPTGSAYENTPFLLREVLPPSTAWDSPLFDPIRDAHLQASSVADDGTVWLGVGGLTRIANGTRRTFRVSDGVASENVLTIYQDSESNVWAGHYGTGLTQMTRVPFFNFSMREGFGGGAAFSLAQTRAGTIWISQSSGLTEVQGQKFRNWSTDDQFPAWAVRTLVVAPDDSLWMLMLDQGIGHFVDGKITTYALPQTPKTNAITALTVTRANEVWGAMGRGGLVKLVDDKLIEVAVPELGTPGCNGPSSVEFPCEQSVNSLVEANDGGFWMGTTGRGLWKRDKQGRSVAVQPEQVGNALVYDVLEEGNGALWVGTDRGLFLIRDGRATAFTRKEGLASDGTFSILDDAHGRLWLCSERGVASVRREEFEAVVAGQAQRVDPVIFRALDGLPSDEMIRRFERSALRAQDGRLWFAAVAGVAVFQPPEKVSVPPPPVARIERVVLKRKQFTPPFPEAEVEVAPGQGDLEFQYTAPAFGAPHRLRFRYKLEGFDRDWVRAAERRSAFYTNIPPGRYTFKVVAERPESGASPVTASFGFTLRPTFFETFWFYLALGGALLLLAVLVQRLRIRAVQAKFQAVLDERNRIARDLHDTLAQVFSAIGFQIDSVIGLVAQGQALPKDRLKRVRQMVAHARLAARNVVWNLRQSEGDESSIRSLISKLEAIPPLYDSVRIVVSSPDTQRFLPAAVENELFHIAQEAVSNAVEHGKAGLISIELEIASDELELLVHDNGVGFEPRPPEQADEPRFGLRGMRERASRIGAQMTMHTEPDVGTEVSVKVKLGQSHAPPDGAAT